MLKIINARVVLPYRISRQDVFIKDGKIVRPTVTDENTEIIDAGGSYLSAGLVDIHTHGIGGYDFMDGTEEALFAIARLQLQNGATTIVPTSLAGSREDTERFLELFKKHGKKTGEFADMPGVHMEGPYFSPAQKGAQPEAFLRNPNPEEYQPILDNYGDIILRWSSAPELDGTEEFAKVVSEKGILLSFAHTDATYDCAVQAYGWGFTHHTHLYSCMSTAHRKNGLRYGGVVESAYLIKDTTVELICDGIHLPAELFKLAYELKGSGRIAVVTDSMRAAGLGEGEFYLGSVESNHKVIVKDGVAWTPDFTSFAGSASTAIDMLRVMVKKFGVSVPEAVLMMTATPAGIMGFKNKGSLTPGSDADLIMFNDDIKLLSVIKSGKQIKIS